MPSLGHERLCVDWVLVLVCRWTMLLFGQCVLSRYPRFLWRLCDISAAQPRGYVPHLIRPLTHGALVSCCISTYHVRAVRHPTCSTYRPTVRRATRGAHLRHVCPRSLRIVCAAG